MGRRGNSNLDQATSSITWQSHNSDVVVERLLHLSNDTLGIPLSPLRIHSSAMSVFVIPITLFAKELWK